MTGTLTMLLVALGACALASVGSFTNVVIARLPRSLMVPNEFGESWTTNPWKDVLSGRSRCDSCDAAVGAWDNVPVISYVVLRGKCRHCRSHIGAFHPLVEAAVPALGLALVWRLGWSIDLLPLLVALPATVAIAVIDARTMIVPTSLVWPSAGVVVALSGLVCASTSNWAPVRSAAIGTVMLALPMLAIWFAMPGGMGFGDVRLSVLLGWLCGWSAAPAAATVVAMLTAMCLLLACLISIAAVMIGGVFSGSSLSRRTKVAFGPGLVVATWLVVAVGGPLNEGFFG